MRSSANEHFWKCYAALPVKIRRQAKGIYALFEKQPYYPSLQFKRIHSIRPIFSVRVNIDYRAVGVLDGDEITWFWIGSHNDYNNLLKRLNKT
jgi:hypothetical protein